MNKMINAAIVGITGYTGEELLKILFKHKNSKVSVIAGRSSSETKPLKDIYPHLPEAAGLTCVPFDAKTVSEKADVIFLALPHRVSFEIVPELLKSGKKVIDLLRTSGSTTEPYTKNGTGPNTRPRLCLPKPFTACRKFTGKR